MQNAVVEAVDHTANTTFITTNVGVTEFPRIGVVPPIGSVITYSEEGFTAKKRVFVCEDVPYDIEIVYAPGGVAAYLLYYGAPLACTGECTNAAGFNAWGNGKKQDLDLLTSYVKGDAS